MAAVWGLIGLAPLFLALYFLVFPQLSCPTLGGPCFTVASSPAYYPGWIALLVYATLWVLLSAAAFLELRYWIVWVEHRHFSFVRERLLPWAVFSVLFSTILGVFLATAYYRLHRTLLSMDMDRIGT